MNRTTFFLLGKVLAGVLVVGIIAYGLYLVFLHSYYARLVQLRVGDFMSSFSEPEDMKSASYLLSARNGGAIYEDGSLDYSQFLKTRTPVDFTKEGGAEALVAYAYVSKQYEVLVNGEVLWQSPYKTQSVALSPSGSRVAFVQTRSVDTADPKNWEVVMLDLVSGDVALLGTGFAIAFINDTTLLRFTDAGVLVQNPEGTVLQKMDEAFTNAQTAVAVSPDKARIAWNTGTETVIVGSNADSSYALTEEARFAAPSAHSLVLTPSSLYAVATDRKTGSTVRRFTFDEETQGEVVRTFPSFLGIAKIVF